MDRLLVLRACATTPRVYITLSTSTLLLPRPTPTISFNSLNDNSDLLTQHGRLFCVAFLTP